MFGKKLVAVAVGGCVVAVATMSVAQDFSGYSPEEIAYSYDYYADAEKTQYLGTVSDQGCGVSGGHVYVIRANVPSAYFDQTPMYVCSGMGPYLPG